MQQKNSSPPESADEPAVKTKPEMPKEKKPLSEVLKEKQNATASLKKDPEPYKPPKQPKRAKVGMVLGGMFAAAAAFGLVTLWLKTRDPGDMPDVDTQDSELASPDDLTSLFEEDSLSPDAAAEIDVETEGGAASSWGDSESSVPYTMGVVEMHNVVKHLPPMYRVTPIFFLTPQETVSWSSRRRRTTRPAVAAQRRRSPPRRRTSRKMYDKDVFYHRYNIITRGPQLQASRPGTVEVALDRRFKRMYLTTQTDAQGNFFISNPPPGDYYWRRKGTRKVHPVLVTPPRSLNLRYDVPEDIDSDTFLRWESSNIARYFRVEFSDSAVFDKITHVYATTVKRFRLDALPEGTWFVRISGLNSQTGQWERSKISALEIP